MRLLFVLVALLWVVPSEANYLVTAYNCKNTTCEQSELRGGPFEITDCNATEAPLCREQPAFAGEYYTMSCYENLSDFPNEYTLLYGWPATNTNCSGEAATKYIIRTGLCERSWTFSRSNSTVTVDIYQSDDTTCSGAINSTHTYDIGVCTTGSHYQGVTVKFE